MPEQIKGTNASLCIKKARASSGGNRYPKWVLTYDIGGKRGLEVVVGLPSLTFAEAKREARTMFDIDGEITNATEVE